MGARIIEISELAEYEVARIIPRLQVAEKNHHKEITAKIYRLLKIKRPGLSGLLTDLFKGCKLYPGREDAIANIVIDRLRRYGYLPYKVTNRRTGIVRLVVPLPRPSPAP